MQIAIASGKGGTGKTTLATNLAAVAATNGRSVAYVDCDVEEPNGHIFLQPDFSEQRDIEKAVPEVDMERCTFCGECGRICQYGAVICIGDQVLVFPELCHACGGCSLVCPTKAIHEEPRSIGKLRIGTAKSIQFVDGVLNVGEHMSPPAIRAVKQAAPKCDLTILDSPPGTSCPVVESVRDCDLVLLITEPTPFGLHDLRLAVDMVRVLKLTLGVVINRDGLGNDDVKDYCSGARIPILAEIPDDRRVAEAYSQGKLATEVIPDYRERFVDLLQKVSQLAVTA